MARPESIDRPYLTGLNARSPDREPIRQGREAQSSRLDADRLRYERRVLPRPANDLGDVSDAAWARVVRRPGRVAQLHPDGRATRQDGRLDLLTNQDKTRADLDLRDDAIRPDSRADLGSVRCPTIVVVRDRDLLTPPNLALTAAMMEIAGD